MNKTEVHSEIKWINLGITSYYTDQKVLIPSTFQKLKKDGWRQLHDLKRSPNTVPVVISKRLQWTGHAAHIGKQEMHTQFLCGNPLGKWPLGRPGRDRLWRWELDETGSRFSPVTGFGVSSVEPENYLLIKSLGIKSDV